jgi:hypothetical protein
MEGEVALAQGHIQRTASPATDTVRKNSMASAREKPSHLMCDTPLRGIAAAAASAYFAYLSYSHLASGDFSLVHTWWTVLTYAVWVTVIGGLLTETLCLRVRIFFSLMLLICLLGLAFSAWSNSPEHAVRQLTIATTALWALAALASLTTAFGSSNRVVVERNSP